MEGVEHIRQREIDENAGGDREEGGGRVVRETVLMRSEQSGVWCGCLRLRLR